MTDETPAPPKKGGKAKDSGKARKAAIDWEAIERDFRAGILTSRQIAAKYGNVSHAGVGARARKYGWEKDLSAKVANRVKSALVAIGVSAGAACGNEGESGNSGNSGNGGAATGKESAPERQAREERTVEEAARGVVQVVRSHRKDVAKASGIVLTLMAQLAEAADYRETLRDMIEDETAGDRSPNRRIAMLKAVSIPAHAGTIRDLSTAMHKLIALERQAFNIAELTTPDPDPPAPEPERAPLEEDPAFLAVLGKLAKLTGKEGEGASPPAGADPASPA